MKNNNFTFEFFDFILSLPNKRDRLVILMVVAGYTKQEIADSLGLSLRTIYFVCSRVKYFYKKDDF